MTGIRFHPRNGRNLKILCLGAHCDDIEIGCGGTLLRILKEFKGSEVHWIVFSSDFRREVEARASAKLFLEYAGESAVMIEGFRDGYFPYDGGKIKDYFEKLKDRISPDVIFTHYRLDLHQDHRTVSDLTWNTFRNHLILEYEIPKYDGDFGAPNFFVPLELSTCRYKIRNILEAFRSQGEKHWFTEELLFSILRIRGMECGSPTDFAEAFYCRKMLFDSSGTGSGG